MALLHGGVSCCVVEPLAFLVEGRELLHGGGTQCMVLVLLNGIVFLLHSKGHYCMVEGLLHVRGSYVAKIVWQRALQPWQRAYDDACGCKPSFRAKALLHG